MTEVKKQLFEDLFNAYDWFVDYKSSVHFDEDKAFNMYEIW